MIKKIFFLLFFFLQFSYIASSQPLPCDDPDAGPCPEEPVPLDSGSGLLIAAGVAYGIKKLNDKRNAGG